MKKKNATMKSLEQTEIWSINIFNVFQMQDVAIY